MSRPQWFKLDVDLFDNPKVLRAIEQGGPDALLLHIQGIAYSTKHLSSGFVPKPMPARWGGKPRHTLALEAAQLWFPTPLDPGDGWLINDFDHYNPTKYKWESVSEARRKAAKGRWD